MKGYLILEMDLPDEMDPSVFSLVLDGVKTALSDQEIERVNRVHAGIGPEGLHEIFAHLSGSG